MAVRRKRKDPHSERKLNATMRTKLVGLFAIVILAFVGLAVRITVINAKDGDAYKKKVLTQSQQQYSSRTLPFKRGDILDTNGTVLATSEKLYNLVLDCKVVNTELNKTTPYIEPTVAALVKFFNINEADVRSRLTDEKTANSQYQILLKEVTIEQKKAFEEYQSPDEATKETLSKEELAVRNNVKGVWFEEDYKRVYPLNSLACDVIGFTYDGTTADWGIEGYYGSVLNGTNGRQYGYVTEDDTTEQTIIEPKDGSTVISTLDANIQKIVEEQIDYMWTALSNGPGGVDGAANIGVIVQNPKNGQILAMGSSKPYDLNDPRDLTKFYSTQEIDAMSEATMLENLQQLWQNYCISTPFELGSTFKPVTVASALDAASVAEDETFYCDGYEKFGNSMIKCSVYPKRHGEQTLADALKNSCNDAMMQIGAAMGAEQFIQYQKEFGFGQKTGIDLPGEASGIIFNKDSMGVTELASSAFGQGFTSTMIQEINAFSACINGGYLYKPTVMKEIVSSSGAVVDTAQSTVIRQAVSSEVSEKVRQYLGTVVASDGTGKYAKVNGYSMGGKTGTAQKMGSANKGKYLVSFIGFAPLNDPQVVVYVVVDEPNAGSQADSRYPQYLYRKIMEQLLPYLNIFQDEEEQTTLKAVRILDEMMTYNYNQQVAKNTTTTDAAQTAGNTTDITQTDATDTAQNTTGDTTETDTTTNTAGTTTGAADFANDPDAQAPQEADNTDLAVPPQDTETVTGGQQLEDGGIANEDINMVN
ncbi:MAG: penicillin-binding transpeptidase domain-containing protein [Lachnospiraceae bacterium]